MSDQLDWISVRGLRATGFHGVFDHERREGQEFVVDLRLGLHVETGTDELTDTVDYSRVSAEVLEVVTGEPVNLIETLAGRIAKACLAHPLVQVATVVVHKPHAPMDLAFEDVCVEITRTREGRR